MKTIDQLQPFTGEEHNPFLWQGGDQAALLIHGFPGTPAEMRPLGRLFHQAGWTVQGLLLPGFGSQITDLHSHTAEDWIESTTTMIRSLRHHHQRIALVGYSMGGAVAINAAVEETPDLLVLLAPFWTLSTGWQDKFWPLLRLFFRSIHPFKDVDFNDIDMRENVRHFLPDVDLDDPAVQESLRNVAVPASVLDQLRRVGRLAFRRAADVRSDTFVIQGRRDSVVHPHLTQKLRAQLPASCHYHEFDADHDLVRPQNGMFAEISRQILAFSSRM